MDIGKYLPQIEQICHRKLEKDISLIRICEGIYSQPGTILLLSGGNTDCARYNILCASPLLQVYGDLQNTYLNTHGHIRCIQRPPLEVVDEIIEHFKYLPPIEDIPVSAGLFGYLSYDLKDHIEDLPKTTIDDLGLPHLYLVLPQIILIEDLATATTKALILLTQEKGREYVHKTLQRLESLTHGDSHTSKGFEVMEGPVSNFTPQQYLNSIKKIKEYIAKGEVYQVNLSQRFEVRYQGEEFFLFKNLFKINPAPFFAYLRANDHTIISTSPERFLYRKGDYIETRPIKGTRPRGKGPLEDERLKRELIESEKDDAELSMIVDLLRNDLGRICRSRGVRVKEHKRVESYENVHHLISIISGELKKEIGVKDIIHATFPGGSITGCPKIRAMEIIDELEPHSRHIYTGCIGYLGFHKNMDLSIAIRTAIAHRGRLFFSVGGGIVFDSDPEMEYEETLHKGKSFLELFQKKSKSSPPARWVWYQGNFIRARENCLPLTSLSTQYGAGLFETMRVEKGRIIFMEEHLSRLISSWKKLFKQPLPSFHLPSIVTHLCELNKFHINQTLRLKLMVLAQEDESPSIGVVLNRYVPRQGRGRDGLFHTDIYPIPRFSPITAHKSLNYLYYYQAGKWASQRHLDEAIILNPDNSISEGNTSNLLAINKKVVYVPLSKYVLPGIMQAKVIDFLKNKNYTIKYKRLFPEDLYSMEMVLLTNSLMGVVAVGKIGTKHIRNSTPKLLGEIMGSFW